MKPEQITAWALDEASAEERQQLETALLENPQDKQKAEETKAFCDFLLTELRDDSLALTDAQREKLKAHTVAQSSRLRSPRPPQTQWRIGVIVRLAIAACIALGGFWTWQSYSEKQAEPQVAAAAEKPGIKVQLTPKPDAKKKATQGPETRLLADKQVKASVVKMEPQAGKALSPAPVPAAVAGSSPLALKKDQRAMTPGDVIKLKQIQDQNAYALNFGDKMEVPAAPLPATAVKKAVQSAAAVAAASAPAATRSGGVLLASSSTLTQQSASVVPLSGGGAMTLAVTTDLPVALSLAPDIFEVNGFINLTDFSAAHTASSSRTTFACIDGLPGGLAMIDLTQDPEVTIKAALTAKLLGRGTCFVLPDQRLTKTAANGLPLTPTPSGLSAALGVSLADYQPSVASGPFGWTASVALVLEGADASTGSMFIRAGSPLTMSAFLQGELPSDFADFIAFGTKNLVIIRDISIGSSGFMWIPTGPYVDATSPGLISFATASRSHLIGRSDIGIPADGLPLLSAFFKMEQGLARNAAALADLSKVSETQAAVFNNGAVVTRSSGIAGIGVLAFGSVAAPAETKAFEVRGDLPLAGGANIAAGSGALVINGAASAPVEKIPPLDFSGAATVLTKAGTIAKVPVTRELLYPAETAANSGSFQFAGAVTGNDTYFKLMGFTDSSRGLGDYTSSAVEETPHGAIAGNAGTLVVSSIAGNAGPSSTMVGQVVTATPMTRNAGGTVALGDVAAGTRMTRADTGAVVLGTGANVYSGGTTVNYGGGATLTKSGAGTLTLTGGTTYTGSTTINGGPLTLAAESEQRLSSGITAGGGKVAGDAPAAALLDLNGTVLSTAATPQPPALVAAGTALVMTNGSAPVTFTTAAPMEQKPQTATATTTSHTAVSDQLRAYNHTNVFVTADPAMKPLQQQLRSGRETVGALTITASPVVAKNLQPVPATVGATIAAVDPTKGIVPWAIVGAAAPAAPAEAPVALSVSPGSDTRYFTVDSISSIATKDMPQKQEAAAVRKATPVEESDPTSGESYTHIIENEMKDVVREPLSTLSIDVDTASYANVRRFLNQNMIPPPDAVRIEELVNYFPTAEEGPAHEAKEPFAVRVELAPCPWQPVHRLARIAIKGREMDKDRKASNLVFLVDVSGSMNEPAKLPLVQQSLRMLTAQLGEGDRVTMVVYAGSSGVVLPPTNGEKKAEILAAIDRLSAGGSTHGSAGIKLAYEQAVAGFIKGGVNRVILCTDGDFNVGVSSPEELEKLIKHKAKTGVFLSVLGFGSGNLKDRTMETLADKGNGNYAYIDSLSEARKVLVEQMSGTLDTIAKDVKIQVEFNPAAVRSYRLIGYENRLLAKEDFNDDTKDAGEIGAGHSVVALYEVVPANLPTGDDSRPAVDSLKYQAPAISAAQLAEGAKSGEMMTVKLRYKAPDSDLSKLIEVPVKDSGNTLTASSDEFKFSAAVAGFGLLLRDSAYKGTLSWETVRRLALDGKGTDKLGYRGEFLQLIDKARGLKETR